MDAKTTQATGVKLKMSQILTPNQEKPTAKVPRPDDVMSSLLKKNTEKMPKETHKKKTGAPAGVNIFRKDENSSSTIFFE